MNFYILCKVLRMLESLVKLWSQYPDAKEDIIKMVQTTRQLIKQHINKLTYKDDVKKG